MIRETRITWQRIVELGEAFLDLQADADEQGADGVGARGATEMPREAAAGEEQAPPPGT